MFDVSSEEEFQDGQVIFDEGASGDWVYVIDSGSVELVKNVDGEPVVIETLQPGDVFGEMAFMANMPRSVTARVRGRTVVGIIDRDSLSTELNKLSGGVRLILQRLAVRLKAATEAAALCQVRRRENRVAKAMSVSFKSHAGLANAFTEDVCGGGMFIRTTSPLPKGERLLLHINLPDGGDALKIGCEVAWQRTGINPAAKPPPGMGLKFVQISRTDQERLRAEIQKGLD